MIDWNQIDTVLLDMDGTLLDLNYDFHFWSEHLPTCYAEAHQCSLEEAKNIILTMVKEREGTLSWYCLDHWSSDLQLDIPALKAEVAHLIQERPHCVKFLKWLKAEGKTSILVTNSHQAGVDLKFKYSAIEPLLDFVYTSHQFKEPKESLAFWEQFHQHHPFNPERAVLIDDNQHVLATAQTFGIEHLLTIAQPNMAMPPGEEFKFPAINCYLNLISAHQEEPSHD